MDLMAVEISKHGLVEISTNCDQTSRAWRQLIVLCKENLPCFISRNLCASSSTEELAAKNPTRYILPSFSVPSWSRDFMRRNKQAWNLLHNYHIALFVSVIDILSLFQIPHLQILAAAHLLAIHLFGMSNNTPSGGSRGWDWTATIS